MTYKKKRFGPEEISKLIINLLQNSKFIITLLYYLLIISISIILLIFFIFLDTNIDISKAMIIPFITAITAIIILIYTKETYELRVIESKKYERELRPILEYKVEQRNDENPFELTLLIHNKSNELISCLVKLEYFILLDNNSFTIHKKNPWKRFQGNRIWNIQYKQTIESKFEITKAFKWYNSWLDSYYLYKSSEDYSLYMKSIMELSKFYKPDYNIEEMRSFKLLFKFHLVSFTNSTNVIPYIPITYIINMLLVNHNLEYCFTSETPAYKYDKIPKWAEKIINNL